MCNEKSNKQAEEYFLSRGLSRRGFGRVGLGAALATMLPGAWASNLVEKEVKVTTPDGEADAYFAHPAKGKHPGVILWPDIFGIRPAYRQMGKRLAEAGYSVLVVNPYYRSMHGALIPEKTAVIGPELRKSIWPKARALAATLSSATAVSDGRAFVKFLDSQPAVDTSKKMGTLGFCMTGSYAFRLAADRPERIGAGASFHGGGLVTDKDDSPHRLVPRLNAGFLVAIAENDDERDPDAKVELRKAFDAAGKQAEIDVYKDTLHGWCPSDSMAHNPAQAERAFERLLVLFQNNLN